jgi:hypothetical protein
MLIASHCTFGTSGGRLWFDANVGAGRPSNAYPFSGGTGIEFSEIHTHSDFVTGAFYLFDVGVVILSQAVELGTCGILADVTPIPLRGRRAGRT